MPTLPAVAFQPCTTAEASQTDILAVPVLLSLSSLLTLPLAPVFEDGPVAWIPCGANVTTLHSLPPLPVGKMACVIALYGQDAVKEARGELQEGLLLTPAWLRSVLRRSEWEDAMAVGPVLLPSAAQAAGQYMYAIAAGHDDVCSLAGTLSSEALDVAERAARRFRAEVQVLSLS